MNEITTAEVTSNPDERLELTVEEARALPGLLGRIAGAALQYHGQYAYIQNGRKVLIVRKDA